MEIAQPSIKGLFSAVGLIYTETPNRIELAPSANCHCPKVVLTIDAFGRWKAITDYSSNEGAFPKFHLILGSHNDKDVLLVRSLMQIKFRLGLISEDEYKWHGFKKPVRKVA